MSFINGVRTRRSLTEKTSVSGLDFSIVGIVGTAPIQNVDDNYKSINKPVLITNAEEGVKYFGNTSKGYTIPAALDAIYTRLNSAKVIVVNVFDPEKYHTTDEDVEGEEEVVYTPQNVSDSDVIGGINSDGTRFGLEALKDSMLLCGYKPRIIIAPEYSAKPNVRTALDKIATTLKAHAYADMDATSVKEAYVRGEDLQSENLELVFPRVKAYNATTEEYEYRALSSYAAASRVYTDTFYGLHYSLGNQEIKGIEGLEVPVYFDIQDENSDSNLLNANGITTVIYDNGYRFWGNRNSTFPDNENVNSFSNQVRVANYIDETLAVKSRQFMSGPINTAMIDDVVNFGKNFLASLKLQGWIIGYDVYFDEKKNNYQSLASGKMVITRKFLAPVPLEELDYESQMDITLYSDIFNEESVGE